MVKVISKNLVELSPDEVVEEIVVEERIFFIKFRSTYRKVHGTIFRYKNGRYREIDWRDNDVKNYFKLPIE